jgi:hypothetical protein
MLEYKTVGSASVEDLVHSHKTLTDVDKALT